jgi:uncharacterized membrane protein
MKNDFSKPKGDAIIGKLVRMLVIAAACIVAVGGAFYLPNYWASSPGYSIFRGEPLFLRSPQGIIASMLSHDSRCLVQFGILLLIAIPMIRVAAYLASFLAKRDWLYSVITCIVFVLLLISILHQ